MSQERTDGLVWYRHHRTGFTLPLPPWWELREDVDQKVAMIAVEPDAGTGFRANVVVTVDEVPEGASLSDWQELNDRVSVEVMTDYLLIDEETFRHAGRTFQRRLAHHTVDETIPVTIQQWSTLAGGSGYTLTGSATTLTFSQTAGMFAAVAAGFTVESEGLA